MAQEYDDIIKYLGAMEKIHKWWKPSWQDITNYVLQRRSFWDTEGQEGGKPATKIYDGSALAALQLLVDGLLGYLVSPKFKWFRLRMQEEAQNDLPGVADFLEEVEDVLYAEFARSNFYEAMSEFFLDAGSIGTAAMLVEDDPGERRTLFTTMHIKEYRIAEARTGLVDTLFRDFKLTNRKMLQTWGELKNHRDRLQDTKDGPYNEARIIHAVYPRSDRDYSGATGLDKPWASEYWDVKYKHLIDEGGYDSFPYLVWRWRKNTDETYGRSPAADAINDIMRLNQMGKTSLMAAQLSVQPPMNIPTSMKGKEKLIPHGSNYYTKADEIISPIDMGARYQIGKEEETEIREQIRDIFRTRIFVLMEMLEGTNKTATEIREIQGEKAAVLGATIGRLNSEVLIPLIDREYAIADRNMKIPDPPEELAGGVLKIEFMGPLAQAQKRYHEHQGVVSSAEFATGMAQIFPTSLDNVDEDELMRIGMDSSGAPQKTIREKPDVDKIRKIRQEEQKRQEDQAVALEQSGQIAANADKLNKPMNPDSMLAGVAKQAAGQ